MKETDNGLSQQRIPKRSLGFLGFGLINNQGFDTHHLLATAKIIYLAEQIELKIYNWDLKTEFFIFRRKCFYFNVTNRIWKDYYFFS